MDFKSSFIPYERTSHTLPTHVGVGHQRIESTSIGCNQWLSLAKIALKVPLAGRNCSLVANTSRCGEGISHLTKNHETTHSLEVAKFSCFHIGIIFNDPPTVGRSPL
jgi:hypothetical protein